MILNEIIVQEGVVMCFGSYKFARDRDTQFANLRENVRHHH